MAGSRGGGGGEGVGSRKAEVIELLWQEADKFQSWKVEQVMHEVLEQRLRDVTYDPVSCQTIAKELATEIQKRVKNFRWQRYRVICQVGTIIAGESQSSRTS